MADDVIENRLFDDEFEELINGYCDINASQALLLDNINEYLDALIGESNG